MAYIATKATYIGEEEYTDGNGNPIKKIKTDVDDVVFATGEVIVLIEEVTEGKHLDLNIEDKESTYFAPTQIKIGDGIHSFQELNWLQTIDSNKIDIAVDNSMQKVVGPIMSKFNDLKITVDTFISTTAREQLKELVSTNYFTIDGNNAVHLFKDESTIDKKNVASFSIGQGNKFYGSPTKYGKLCVSFGRLHYVYGLSNYVFGYNNNVFGNYNFIHGQTNTIGDEAGNSDMVTCFGNYNTILNYNHSIFGSSNNINGQGNFIHGNGNTINGENNFIHGTSNEIESTIENASIFGVGNKVDINTSFACGKYNISTNKIFSIGNGVANKRSNIFDIDADGKATFYGDLEVRGSNYYNGEQLESSVFGFRTTSAKNLYKLVTLGGTSDTIVSTNYFIFKGIYEIIIIPKNQEIQSVYTDVATGSKNIPFNQPFYMTYNGVTPDRLIFQLNSGVTNALVHIIIRKISD